MKHSQQYSVLSIILWILLASINHAQGEPSIHTQPPQLKATPYRPTVGSPAELPTPKYLEIEGGWLGSHGDCCSNKSVQYLTKYAFNDNWGVLLGGDLWASQRSMSDSITGFGDTYFVVKHLFDLNLKSQSLGVEVGVNLPTSKKGLGSKQTDFLAKGIYSLVLTDNWRIDTNLGLTHLGAVEGLDGHNVIAWSSGVAYSLDKWGLALELSGTQQSNVADTKQMLVAASYAITPRIVVDMSYANTKQDSNEQSSIGIGATWLISKMF